MRKGKIDRKSLESQLTPAGTKTKNPQYLREPGSYIVALNNSQELSH